MKSNIMSTSIAYDTQKLLDVSAKKMGWTRSELIRRLIAIGLDLVVNNGEEIPVILKIPVNLKNKPNELRQWLYQKSDAIVGKFSEK